MEARSKQSEKHIHLNGVFFVVSSKKIFVNSRSEIVRYSLFDNKDFWLRSKFFYIPLIFSIVWPVSYFFLWLSFWKTSKHSLTEIICFPLVQTNSFLCLVWVFGQSISNSVLHQLYFFYIRKNKHLLKNMSLFISSYCYIAFLSNRSRTSLAWQKEELVIISSHYSKKRVTNRKNKQNCVCWIFGGCKLKMGWDWIG